ncbi:alpha/beta fold hydrolase [Hasllibacter sp. MH4015]|uniref:alpha/beta fold hydrolase n=1 Tax=Hasllibacter sp. MH4015 TaxID=2854029 RepID=UPI001CD7C717|nr:alpha/beta fold hydrolase [Hasllibacter sp. MH4015]
MRYEFGPCELDVAGHRLVVGGMPVHVEPQVFDLIAALAKAAPDLLSYDDMIAQVWKGRIVSEATLSARISAARAALGDTGKAQAVLRTVPRRGVQLVLPVNRHGGLPKPDAPMSDRQVIRYIASADGTSIAYATSGQEGPVLVRGGHWLSHLEHDWSNPVWRPWLERLGHGRRLVRYDPRGSGLSQRGVAALTQSQFVDDLACVLDATTEGPVDVFAVSQSVPVVLSYAARHPGRIRRMVLVNGFVEGSILRGDVDATQAMVSMIRAGWGDPASPFVQAFTKVFLPDADLAETNSIASMQAVSASAEEAANLRLAIGAFDASAILEQVLAPALVLSSQGDAIHPRAQSLTLARRLPNAEFQSLETSNHIIPPSDPAFGQMMDAVDLFLAD